jgi:hypothetical protein
MAVTLWHVLLSSALAGGFNWGGGGGGGQAWSVEDIMSHFFSGGGGGFAGGMFTSAAFMMDVPLRLTFMVRTDDLVVLAVSELVTFACFQGF